MIDTPPTSIYHPLYWKPICFKYFLLHLLCDSNCFSCMAYLLAQQKLFFKVFFLFFIEKSALSRHFEGPVSSKDFKRRTCEDWVPVTTMKKLIPVAYFRLVKWIFSLSRREHVYTKHTVIGPQGRRTAGKTSRIHQLGKWIASVFAPEYWCHSSHLAKASCISWSLGPNGCWRSSPRRSHERS